MAQAIVASIVVWSTLVVFFKMGSRWEVVHAAIASVEVLRGGSQMSLKELWGCKTLSAVDTKSVAWTEIITLVARLSSGVVLTAKGPRVS